MATMRDAQIIKTDVIVDSFKRVVREKVQFSENDIQDWIYLDTPKSIAVVALTPKLDIILVNLYRHNLRQDVCELPSGIADKTDKSPIDAARRELLEETGYESANFVDLGSYYVLPSETNRRVQYYLALNVLQKQKPKFDDLIEKYFDMSVTSTSFKDIITLEGAAKHSITGMESLFGIRLAKEHLDAAK
jgi:ADP-ribose pyrophosphatase